MLKIDVFFKLFLNNLYNKKVSNIIIKKNIKRLYYSKLQTDNTYVIFIPVIFSVWCLEKKDMSASCHFYVIISDIGISRDYIPFCDFIFG